MAKPPSFVIGAVCWMVAWAAGISAEEQQRDFSPRPEEQQLPLAMHSKMEQRPRVSVGREDADLVGADNRALQAAVDYVASLGGGVVEIGPGQYLMRDSLHLRSHVTVRGAAGKTILRKADAAVSPLALDGDFGEQQITVEDPAGFDVAAGVAVWDDGAAGIRIRGETNNLLFEGNIIRDTREADAQTQTVGVLIEERVGEVTLKRNRIEAKEPIEDRRR